MVSKTENQENVVSSWNEIGFVSCSQGTAYSRDITELSELNKFFTSGVFNPTHTYSSQLRNIPRGGYSITINKTKRTVCNSSSRLSRANPTRYTDLDLSTMEYPWTQNLTSFKTLPIVQKV